MQELAWELDWNLLRTYMVIVQEGSITGAANKLSLTQPSVSNRLTVLMRNVQEELTGHVRISMASHITCPIVDNALADFHANYPKVTFNMQVLTSRNVQRSVLQKEAGFGMSLEMEHHPCLDYTHLYREHFGFFCGESHHLFGVEGIGISQLRNEAMVSFESDQLSDALRPVALLRVTEGMRGLVVGTSSHLEEVKRMIVKF